MMCNFKDCLKIGMLEMIFLGALENHFEHPQILRDTSIYLNQVPMYGLKLGCYFCMDTRIQVESAAHYFGKHHPYPQSKGHNAGSKIKKGQLLSIKTLALFELFSLPSELLLPRFANCNLSSPVLLILLGIEGEMAQLAHIKQSNGWTVAPPHLPLWCPRSVMGHPPPACPSLGTKLQRAMGTMLGGSCIYSP